MHNVYSTEFKRIFTACSQYLALIILIVYSHIWLETIVSVMCYGCVWKCMWDHRINLFWISNNAAKEDEKENEIEKDKKNKGKQGQTTSSFIHTHTGIWERFRITVVRNFMSCLLNQFVFEALTKFLYATKILMILQCSTFRWTNKLSITSVRSIPYPLIISDK